MFEMYLHFYLTLADIFICPKKQQKDKTYLCNNVWIYLKYRGHEAELLQWKVGPEACRPSPLSTCPSVFADPEAADPRTTKTREDNQVYQQKESNGREWMRVSSRWIKKCIKGWHRQDAEGVTKCKIMEIPQLNTLICSFVWIFT